MACVETKEKDRAMSKKSNISSGEEQQTGTANNHSICGKYLLVLENKTKKEKEKAEPY